MESNYEQLVKALRCKSLSKECDSCGYGYRLCPDSECNDACHVEQIYADAAAAIEELQAQLPKRGEWIYHPKDAIEMMFTLPKCSICGHESSDALNYCPNCGSLMRGEANERS